MVPMSFSAIPHRIAGSCVTFLGTVSEEEVRCNFSACRTPLFPGPEDFGKVPVEAQFWTPNRVSSRFSTEEL
jgi:hypothetical protein